MWNSQGTFYGSCRPSLEHNTLRLRFNFSTNSYLVIILTSLPGNPWREEVYVEPSSKLHFYQSKCLSFLPVSFSHQPWVLTPNPMSALAVVKQQGWVAQLTDLQEHRMARPRAATRRTSWVKFSVKPNPHILGKLQKGSCFRNKRRNMICCCSRGSESAERTGQQCLAPVFSVHPYSAQYVR